MTNKDQDPVAVTVALIAVTIGLYVASRQFPGAAVPLLLSCGWMARSVFVRHC
jgi:hypothetical protein